MFVVDKATLKTLSTSFREALARHGVHVRNQTAGNLTMSALGFGDGQAARATLRTRPLLVGIPEIHYQWSIVQFARLARAISHPHLAFLTEVAGRQDNHSWTPLLMSTAIQVLGLTLSNNGALVNTSDGGPGMLMDTDEMAWQNASARLHAAISRLPSSHPVPDMVTIEALVDDCVGASLSMGDLNLVDDYMEDELLLSLCPKEWETVSLPVTSELTNVRRVAADFLERMAQNDTLRLHTTLGDRSLVPGRVTELAVLARQEGMDRLVEGPSSPESLPIMPVLGADTRSKLYGAIGDLLETGMRHMDVVRVLADGLDADSDDKEASCMSTVLRHTLQNMLQGETMGTAMGASIPRAEALLVDGVLMNDSTDMAPAQRMSQAVALTIDGARACLIRFISEACPLLDGPRNTLRAAAVASSWDAYGLSGHQVVLIAERACVRMNQGDSPAMALRHDFPSKQWLQFAAADHSTKPELIYSKAARNLIYDDRERNIDLEHARVIDERKARMQEQEMHRRSGVFMGKDIRQEQEEACSALGTTPPI